MLGRTSLVWGLGKDEPGVSGKAVSRSGLLITFVLVQCVLTTQFGISNAEDLQGINETSARVVVNLNRIPSAIRACYFESMVVGPNIYSLEAWRGHLERNHPERVSTAYK